MRGRCHADQERGTGRSDCGRSLPAGVCRTARADKHPDQQRRRKRGEAGGPHPASRSRTSLGLWSSIALRTFATQSNAPIFLWGEKTITRDMKERTQTDDAWEEYAMI